MNYTSQRFVQGPSDKIYVGDQVRCSYGTRETGGGCHHGQIISITAKGIYIDVGNKQPKYAAFIDIIDLSLAFGG